MQLKFRIQIKKQKVTMIMNLRRVRKYSKSVTISFFLMIEDYRSSGVYSKNFIVRTES